MTFDPTSWKIKLFGQQGDREITDSGCSRGWTQSNRDPESVKNLMSAEGFFFFFRMYKNAVKEGKGKLKVWKKRLPLRVSYVNDRFLLCVFL